MHYKSWAVKYCEFDQMIARWLEQYSRQGKVIHCGKGCSGCCHLAVHATYPEAVAVAAGLSTENLNRLTQYIGRIVELLPSMRELKSYLRLHRQEAGPCPFLDQAGECSIYSARPFSCRALLSTRPAAWCSVDFSTLDEWDKQVYDSSLDRQVVAWPTHFVAATQDLGQAQEKQLIERMSRDRGWALAGNFAVMVWLEHSLRLSAPDIEPDQARQKLTGSGLHHPLLLDFTVTP